LCKVRNYIRQQYSIILELTASSLSAAIKTFAQDIIAASIWHPLHTSISLFVHVLADIHHIRLCYYRIRIFIIQYSKTKIQFRLTLVLLSRLSVIITALVATYLKDDTIMELSASHLQARNGLQDVPLVYPAATPNNGKMGNGFESEKLENRKLLNTLITTLFSKFIVTIYGIMSWPMF